jgi:hypothetical protein
MNKKLKILNNGRSLIRAAIFVRAIAPDIDQNASIRMQLEHCGKFIQRNGWIVTDLYLEKEGDAILRLMRARAQSGCFDTIVAAANPSAESPARHARSLRITAICDARLWSAES